MKKTLIVLLIICVCLVATGCQYTQGVKNAQDIESEKIYMKAYKIVDDEMGFSYDGEINNPIEQSDYEKIAEVLALLKQLPPDYTRGSVTIKETIEDIENNILSPMLGNWKCYAKNSVTDKVFEFRLSIYARMNTMSSYTEDYKTRVPVIGCSLRAYNTVYLDGEYFYTPELSDYVTTDYRMEGQQLLRRDRASAIYRYDKTDDNYKYISAEKYVQVID